MAIVDEQREQAHRLAKKIATEISLDFPDVDTSYDLVYDSKRGRFIIEMGDCGEFTLLIEDGKVVEG